MSYSVCIECRSMVSAYQKYCVKCAANKRENPGLFWKEIGDRNFSPKDEIAKDTLTEPELKQRVLERYEAIDRGANPNGNRAERRRAAALQRKRKS